MDKRRRKKEKLKITFFNSDGIGKYDLKIDYITEMIRMLADEPELQVITNCVCVCVCDRLKDQELGS